MHEYVDCSVNVSHGLSILWSICQPCVHTVVTGGRFITFALSSSVRLKRCRLLHRSTNMSVRECNYYMIVCIAIAICYV